MDDAIKRFRQRRSARLGFETIKHYDSVKEYRKRRAERLAARMDDDGDEENTPIPKKSGGGHGNTKIPFGLCQREGIEIQPGWTPQDAWEALEGKGYNPGEVYKGLKETGKANKAGKGAASGTQAGKPVKMSAEEASKVSSDYREAREKYLSSQTELRVAKGQVKSDERNIQAYQEEWIPKAQKEYDDAQKAYSKIKTGKTIEQLEAEEKKATEEATELIAFANSLTRKPPDVGSPERERWEKAILGSAEEVIGPPPEEGTEERERWNRWAFDTMAYDIGTIAQKKLFGQFNEARDKVVKLGSEKNMLKNLESKKDMLDKHKKKLQGLMDSKAKNEEKIAEAEALMAESDKHLKENADKYRDAVNSQFPTYEDCKTFEDVEEKLRANGCVGHGKHVDFEGITIESAAMAAKSINEFYDKFPEMKTKLGSIVTETMEHGVYAGSSGCDTIYLNKRNFGNLEEMKKSWQRDVDNAFHPVGTGASAILYHEMAHQMDSFLTQVLRKDDLQQHWSNRKNISTVVLEEVCEKLGMKADDVKKEVSGYAQKRAVVDAYDDRSIEFAGFYNGHDVEFFAEAIAEYIGSPKPRRVAVEVWNCLQKYIKQSEGKEIDL